MAAYTGRLESSGRVRTADRYRRSVPAIGTAAAVGLVVYFVGAAIVHMCAGDYSVSGQHVFLLLAVAILVLDLGEPPLGEVVMVEE
ncbi:DoxX family protein [Natrinema sp. 74]|uniref:DoxX family protein n=1 Tax=Natrinema sp. 74 TaxID=3384159 RepID=UPI0038D4B97C